MVSRLSTPPRLRPRLPALPYRWRPLTWMITAVEAWSGGRLRVRSRSKSNLRKSRYYQKAEVVECQQAATAKALLMPLAPSPVRVLFCIDEGDEYETVEPVLTPHVVREDHVEEVNASDLFDDSLEGSAPSYVLSVPNAQAYCVPIDGVLTILGVPTITVSDYTWTPPAGLLGSRIKPHKTPVFAWSDDIVVTLTRKMLVASPSYLLRERATRRPLGPNRENKLDRITPLVAVRTRCWSL